MCLSARQTKIIFDHKFHKFSLILSFYLILKFVVICEIRREYLFFIMKTKTTKIALDGFV